MARPEKFPYVPNMDDCKMTVETEGAVCYIMDTCCRQFTPADKAAADRKLMDLALRAALRKASSGLA